MACWHEAKKHRGGWVFPPKSGSRVGVVFRGEDARVAPFEGYFMRYEGGGSIPDGPFPHWKKNPQGWVELWPREPLRASSMEEAKRKFAPMLRQVEDGSLDERFEKRPCRPPARPARVKEIDHPTHVARAVIVQHPEGMYEVGYLVYAPNGRYFPAATPSISSELEWEWGVTWVQDENGQDMRTLADDLEDAEEIARIELDMLVRNDSMIRRRPE
jgi:hypothetical protein